VISFKEDDHFEAEEEIPFINWVLAVDEGVGPFRFDLSVEEVRELIDEYGLIKIIDDEPSDVIDWDTYEIPGCESRIYIRHDGLIDYIGCYDELYFEGSNLIGMTRDELVSLLGEESEVEDFFLFYYPACYYESGLGISYDEFWVVTSISVSRLEDYEDVVDE